MNYCPTLLKIAAISLKLATAHGHLSDQLARGHRPDLARAEAAMARELRASAAEIRQACAADPPPAPVLRPEIRR